LASGAPFVAWATFPVSELRLLRGQLAQYRSSKKVLRGFCATCGTTMTYVHEARPAEIDIALATLDDPSSLQPECHIWMSDKLAWVDPADQLPRYQEWRESASLIKPT
jgi:hypothetical protein